MLAWRGRPKAWTQGPGNDILFQSLTRDSRLSPYGKHSQGTQVTGIVSHLLGLKRGEWRGLSSENFLAHLWATLFPKLFSMVRS